MIPLYRLDGALTRAWAINREARHRLAEWLAHRYPKSGASVVTNRLLVIAHVNPLAQIIFATPPYVRVERYLCVNNPSWQACECLRWFDVESGGAWGRRHSERHHPLCIFDALAAKRWQEVELPEKVTLQAERGGFLESNATVQR